MGDGGVHALAEALKVNTVLQMLDLRYNSVGAEGADALAEALKVNTSLQTLDLRFNPVGRDGERALKAAVDNRSGFKLQLS